MGTPQQFSLKWNNYSQHIVNAFEDLRGVDDLTDVTLSCEGKRIKAHKVLLSACSVYFKETFRVSKNKKLAFSFLHQHRHHGMVEFECS